MSGLGERRVWIAAGLGASAIVLALLAIAGVFSADGDGSGIGPDESGKTGPPPTGRNPNPGVLVEGAHVGGQPDAIAVGTHFVWVTDSRAGTVKRLAPLGDRPIPVEVAGFPTDITAEGTTAWVALPDRGAVQRLSADGPAGTPVRTAGFPFKIDSGAGGVWAMSQKVIERLGPSTAEPEGEPIRLSRPGGSIATGDEEVFVATGRRDVVRIDASTGEITGTASVPGIFSITFGEGAVWALGAAGTLIRVDPDSLEADPDWARVSRALDVAAGLGYVWVSSPKGIHRFDPVTGRSVSPPIRLSLKKQPVAIAIGEHSLWVASASNSRVFRVTPSGSLSAPDSELRRTP